MLINIIVLHRSIGACYLNEKVQEMPGPQTIVPLINVKLLIYIPSKFDQFVTLDISSLPFHIRAQLEHDIAWNI